MPSVLKLENTSTGSASLGIYACLCRSELTVIAKQSASSTDMQSKQLNDKVHMVAGFSILW